MIEGKLLGSLVNSIAIIAGTGVGLVVRGGIVQKYQESIMHAVSLSIIVIGIKSALDTADLLIVILSLAIGTLIGEGLEIEERLHRFGKWIEQKWSSSESGLAKGFVNASLVYCVGSMAIVGSLESGLTNNHQILFAKSILDGIISIVFASVFGIGVMLSAVSVFLYQGFITMTASLLQQFLIPSVVAQMSGVGGVLIMAIGINVLEIKKIKVGNMLPATFLPLCYFMLKQGIQFFF